jgi:hypothetical protein
VAKLRFNIIKSSYNIAPIFNPFVGLNNLRFGKTVSQETRNKISKTLKGRVMPDVEKQNHITGSHKKLIYCYDYFTKEYLFMFESIRGMSRVLSYKNYESIRRKIDNNKPLNCVYKGKSYTLFLYSSAQ